MKTVRSEKVEQSHIVQLVALLGGKAYVKGGHRKRGDYQGTMQTPGIPDLDVFLPARTVGGGRGVVGPLFAFVEAKRAGGRQSPEQKAYQQLCRERDIAYVLGTYDAFVAWLVGLGYVRADAFPHYRQPKEAV